MIQTIFLLLFIIICLLLVLQHVCNENRRTKLKIQDIREQKVELLKSKNKMHLLLFQATHALDNVENQNNNDPMFKIWAKKYAGDSVKRIRCALLSL